MLEFSQIPSVDDVVASLQETIIKRISLSDSDLIKEVVNVFTKILELQNTKYTSPEKLFQWEYLCLVLNIFAARTSTSNMQVYFSASHIPDFETLSKGGWYVFDQPHGGIIISTLPFI